MLFSVNFFRPKNCCPRTDQLNLIFRLTLSEAMVSPRGPYTGSTRVPTEPFMRSPTTIGSAGVSAPSWVSSWNRAAT